MKCCVGWHRLLILFTSPCILLHRDQIRVALAFSSLTSSGELIIWAVEGFPSKKGDVCKCACKTKSHLSQELAAALEKVLPNASRLKERVWLLTFAPEARRTAKRHKPKRHRLGQLQ